MTMKGHQQWYKLTDTDFYSTVCYYSTTQLC